MMPPTRKEKTGWRDLSLSLRHRDWGFNCPAVDIDLLVEFNCGIPAAIIEYKRWNSNPDDSVHSIRCLEILADRAKVAFFVVRYTNSESNWFFEIVLSNGIGAEIIRANGYRFPLRFSEIEFVRFLYRLRRLNDQQVQDLPVFKEAR